MRLDYDLFRELLFIFEDKAYPHALLVDLRFEHESLSECDSLLILYHVKKMYEANLIEAKFYPQDNAYNVLDVTMKGHELIAQIRSDNIWNKTKDIAETIGVKSLESLACISSNVLANLIKGFFL